MFYVCFYPLIFLFPCVHRYATTTSVQRNTDSTDATNKQIKGICRKATNIRSIRYIRVREKKKHDLRGFHSTTDPTDLTLSLQKNATQSHKLQNNQGKSMIAEDSFVPLL